MKQCFKDHEFNTKKLHVNTKPISECKSITNEYKGGKVTLVEVPVLTPEALWRVYQQEAEEIVAPGGVLIADPKERNRAINAAYAKLWLHDDRFQWAGLAAFASKQVGCGLLHAVDSIKTFRKAQDTIESRSGIATYLADLLPALFAADGTAIMFRLQLEYVYKMLALGNTTLFLDVFPLHAFYKKRGLKELKICLKARQNIYGDPKFPVLWPAGQEVLRFGKEFPEILRGFGAIDAGEIAEGVKHLARHEQVNVLQPVMYDDLRFAYLIRSNHFAYVTKISLGLAEPIELTFSNRCRAIDTQTTATFSERATANLADPLQRLPFVFRAAEQFGSLLHSGRRQEIEKALKLISANGGAR